MQPLLNIAVKAARRAGDIIVRAIPRLEAVQVESKGRNDFVTEVDKAAEADIIQTIRRMHPDHAVFAVSIACQIRGRLEHAVVFDPMRQEVFTASRGDGAQCEGRKIRVSKQITLEGSLIATGFPYRADAPYLDEYLAMLKAVMLKASGLRRPGAAALDLAYVAAGRVDGFWEIGLQPWDTAAGTLLITEAGGRVGTIFGEDYKQGGHIIAGTPKVYAALVAELSPHAPASLRDA